MDKIDLALRIWEVKEKRDYNNSINKIILHWYLEDVNHRAIS